MVMIGASGDGGGALVSSFGSSWDLIVIPFEERHAEVAIDAFGRYGKGRHPAALNILDCMTYATARIAGEPLLFTGNDFARTDIAAA
jgi:ribonuclease VapC